VSAYLERLATSTRQPAAGIAPLAGPLYLSSRAASEPTAGVPGRPPAATRLPAAARDVSLPRSPAPPLEAQAPADPPTPAPTAAFEPLLPAVQPETEAASARGGGGDGEDAPVDAPPETPLRAFSQPSRATPLGPQLLPAERTEPQPARSGPARPMVRTSRPDGTPLPPGRTSTRLLASGQAAEGASEEIRIHIGRVEVVATGPPPAPPAQHRERTSLRLEDYLRKGG
jgi:hypothetical protein